MIELLINHFYYRSNALVDYVDEIINLDPTAYIVAVSDHLPTSIDYKALGYRPRFSHDKVELNIKENLVFVIDKGQWKKLGLIRHKDLFYKVMDSLTNNQYCIENECNLYDLNAHLKIKKYQDLYAYIMRQAMQ